ncbi:MAG TPA: hypothetical protein VFL93_04890 [Longimicrobiaceae bacterium]|nr:hypothetical protein [Longimicrobiaceae bacterium]
MRLWKLAFAGAALALIAAAFRDFENDTWLAPAGLGAAGRVEEENEAEEPVLGYDGMDVDTLLDWLDDANLDEETLLRMHDYEERHLAREPILAAIDEQVGDRR